MQTPRIAIATAAILAAVSPATAENRPILIQVDVPTATVSYADLAIGSAPGQQTLERRVELAATRLCLENRRAPVAELLEQRRCFATAMTQAKRDIAIAVGRSHAQVALGRTIRIAAR
jgi:UrcA family protein